MISLIVELVLVVGISVLAHLLVAYSLAPKKAKEGILKSLTTDDEFQSLLMRSIIKNLMSPMKFRAPDGSEVEQLAIDPILKRGLEGLQSWIQGKQSGMAKEMDSNAQKMVQSMSMGQNPLISIALSQIPKKYQWIIPLLLGSQQQPPEY